MKMNIKARYLFIPLFFFVGCNQEQEQKLKETLSKQQEEMARLTTSIAEKQQEVTEATGTLQAQLDKLQKQKENLTQQITPLEEKRQQLRDQVQFAKNNEQKKLDRFTLENDKTVTGITEKYLRGYFWVAPRPGEEAKRLPADRVQRIDFYAETLSD